MSDNIRHFLESVNPFSLLSGNELDAISDRVKERRYSDGHIIGIAQKTKVFELLVIVHGRVGVYDGVGEEKRLLGQMVSGQVIGAAAVLFNQGILEQTLISIGDTVCYSIPEKPFLECCDHYPAFHDVFIRQQEDNFPPADADEASRVSPADEIIRFLSGVPPFSLIPDEGLAAVRSSVTMTAFEKDTVLAGHGESVLKSLYIIKQGSAEQYREKSSRKIMRKLLCEGDVFGGMDMLLNGGISLFTVRCMERCFFYMVPEQTFLELCMTWKHFSDFFTDAFGRLMMHDAFRQGITGSEGAAGSMTGFYHQALQQVDALPPVYCDPDTAIRDVVRQMHREKTGAVLVSHSENGIVGIVTKTDLINKALADNQDMDLPVAGIMSHPVQKISATSGIYEALAVMNQMKIGHIPVVDPQNRVLSILSDSAINALHGYSPLLLIKEIQAAGSPEIVMTKPRRLPFIIRNLIRGGAHIRDISRIITLVSDTVLEKLMEFAIKDLGQPPVKFVFMILGSEGRLEQTLKTDQDNAVIYEDSTDVPTETIEDYFSAFGKKVCSWLDQAGYAYCKGGIMAQNPKWCQPLSAWKDYFSSWIVTADHEDLLQASIFFDFRGAWGSMELIEQLRQLLFESVGGWSGFLRHLTENALHFKPPIGLLGKIVVESRGRHRDAFDLKAAMQPIVDFARIYCLSSKTDATNTFERLSALHRKQVISEEDYNDTRQAYAFLLNLRLNHQVTQIIDENQRPDNYIHPKKLSRIDQMILREVFKQIERLQGKLSFDFIGTA